MSLHPTPPARRYVLVPAATPPATSAQPRRLRLARLAADPAERPVSGRFDYLKRTYD